MMTHREALEAVRLSGDPDAYLVGPDGQPIRDDGWCSTGRSHETHADRPEPDEEPETWRDRESLL